MFMSRLFAAASLALVTSFGAPAVAADRALSREFLEVTGFDVAITAMQQTAMNGPGIAGGDPDAFGVAWVRLAENVFDPDGMIEETLDMMEAIMPQELIEHGIAFYGSELGARLVEAENASQLIDNGEQMAEGELIVTRLAEDNPERIEEYRKMNAAIGGVESSVRAIIEVQLRYYLGAMAAGAAEIRYSEEELRQILNEQAPRMAEAIEVSSVLGAAYVYQTFSDQEVADYRAALEAPEMQQVYEILNGIQYQIMGDRYETLAAQLASLSPQTDL